VRRLPAGAARVRGSADIPIVVANTHGERTSVTLAELFPHPFTLH